VRQDASTQRYEPGIRLLQLAESVRDRFGITRAAHDELVRLRDESGQSVTLTTVLDEGVVVLELVPSHSGVEFGIRPGTRMALHCSAHGKVALAFGPERLFERCIAEGTGAHGSGTPLQPERLRRDIAQIRRRGWATAANEVLIGMNALAAPVRDHRGDFAGAIAIVGSTQYIEARPAEAQLQAVQGAARRISGRLGWQGERS
jgi:DNA-binding IclR family transcriptional regulator